MISKTSAGYNADYKDRGAFHQTEINNGTTIITFIFFFFFFFTGVMSTCLPSGFTQKCGLNLMKYCLFFCLSVFLMLGTWSIFLYPPTLAQISTLRKVPTTSTQRSRPGEQLLFCPKPKSSPFLSTRLTEPIPGIRSVSVCSCVIQSHPGSVKAMMPALDRRLDLQMGKICNSEGIVNSVVLLGLIGPMFYTFACGF